MKMLLSVLIYAASISILWPNQNYLIGKWESFEDNSSSEEMIIGGSSEPVVFHLTFRHDGTGYDFSTEAEFKYVLDGKILTIGSNTYEVLKLSKNELIIKEMADELSLEETVTKFIKIEG